MNPGESRKKEMLLVGGPMHGQLFDDGGQKALRWIIPSIKSNECSAYVRAKIRIDDDRTLEVLVYEHAKWISPQVVLAMALKAGLIE